MDIIRYLNILAIISPIIYAIFLLFRKISLVNVNKKILNNGLILANLVSFVIFSLSLFLIITGRADNFYYGINYSIDKNNILFLEYSSLIALVISVFIKIYFGKYIQFVFTKQTHIILLSFLISNVYLFVIAKNILFSFVFWFLGDILIYLFGYYDLIKNNFNTDITRVSKISAIGSFSYLALFLILNKTGISNYNLAGFFFILTLATKLYIFPFGCYTSFLASCSSLVYLSIVCFVNFIFGSYFFKTLFNVFPDSLKLNSIIIIISIITILSSLFFVLFEKNIKIIIGYLFAAFNSLFLVSYVVYQNNIILGLYSAINLIIMLILAYLFYINKTGIKKRFFIKQKGFVLEKSFILIFEKSLVKISSLFNFIDKKLIPILALFFAVLLIIIGGVCVK